MNQVVVSALFLVCLSCVAQAFVCQENICDRVRCKAVDEEECRGTGGLVRLGAGFCGCCDACIIQQGEGENCGRHFLGVPATHECREDLECHPLTRQCTKKKDDRSCFVILLRGEPVSHGCLENELCHPQKNVCVTREQIENEEQNRKCATFLVRGEPVAHGCRQGEVCHPDRQVCLSLEEFLEEINRPVIIENDDE